MTAIRTHIWAEPITPAATCLACEMPFGSAVRADDSCAGSPPTPSWGDMATWLGYNIRAGAHGGLGLEARKEAAKASGYWNEAVDIPTWGGTNAGAGGFTRRVDGNNYATEAGFNAWFNRRHLDRNGPDVPEVVQLATPEGHLSPWSTRTRGPA